MIPLRDDNPTEITPIVTVTLIAACVLAFGWQWSLGAAGERIVYALGMIPASLFGSRQLAPELALIPPAATLFSSMFLHGGVLHLAGNLLYLWIFGNNVEDAMGHGRFVLFYVTCGVAAALAQALADPASTVPMIGASGAISGVLGAYLLLYPHARVLVALPLGFYIHTFTVKAGWVLGIWFATQIISSLMTRGAGDGVAWLAHVGGFIAGMALVVVFKRRHVALFNPARRGSN